MGVSSPLPPEMEELAKVLIDSAFKVHQALGPGLLESIYEACLCFELRNRGIAHEVQVPVDIIYAGERIDAGLRIDLLVERSIILELKAVDRLMPIHQAQLLTYLKLTDLRLGLLINFNVALFKEGVKRMIR